MNVDKLTRILQQPARRLALLPLTLALAVGSACFTLPAAAAPMGDMGAPMMMMGHHGHIDRALGAVNATPEQRSQIKSILDAAHADLKAQHESAKGLRQQSLTLFTQPTVDARAAETLRQQMLSQHDQASKRMLQAMLDISRVLTPDQRKQLGDMATTMSARMERHRGPGDAADRPAVR